MAFTLTIAAIGKGKGAPEQALADNYVRQTGWPVRFREFQPRKVLEGEALKQAEAELLLQAVPAGAVIVALDERGKEISSVEFSNTLVGWQDEGVPEVVFCIGGADGLSEEMRQKARLVMRLGKMTWPHMLVRTLLAEQLYRAWTIYKGHPYHRA